MLGCITQADGIASNLAACSKGSLSRMQILEQRGQEREEEAFKHFPEGSAYRNWAAILGLRGISFLFIYHFDCESLPCSRRQGALSAKSCAIAFRSALGARFMNEPDMPSSPGALEELRWLIAIAASSGAILRSRILSAIICRCCRVKDKWGAAQWIRLESEQMSKKGSKSRSSRSSISW